MGKAQPVQDDDKSKAEKLFKSLGISIPKSVSTPAKSVPKSTTPSTGREEEAKRLISDMNKSGQATRQPIGNMPSDSTDSKQGIINNLPEAVKDTVFSGFHKIINFIGDINIKSKRRANSFVQPLAAESGVSEEDLKQQAKEEGPRWFALNAITPLLLPTGGNAVGQATQAIKRATASKNAVSEAVEVEQAVSTVAKADQVVETANNAGKAVGRLSKTDEVLPASEKVIQQLNPAKPKVPTAKPRGFTQTVAKSDQTAQGVKETLAGRTNTYNPITNEAAQQAAVSRIKKGVKNAEQFVMDTAEPSAEHTATGIELIKRYQSQGKHELAANIADNLAEKLTKAGQSIQAAKLYENLSPEGILIKAQKLVKEANRNKPTRWSKDILLGEDTAKQLGDLAKEMSKAKGDLKTEIANEISSIINSLKRSSVGDKISSAQTVMQLLNPKTLLTRNPLGNEIFYRLERANKYVSTPIDWARSTLTGGPRTVTFKSVKQGEYWNNWMKGLKAGWKGIDPSGIKSSMDLPPLRFKSKWNPLAWGEKALGATIKSFDNAAFMRAKNETVGELAYLKALNEGKKGKAAKDAAVKYAQGMDNKALQIADDYGKYITFQDDNLLSRGFSAVKRGLNVGKGFGLGDLVLKYPKVPGALIMRGLEYSPAGVLRSLYLVAKPWIKGKPVNVREATEALSRAITGTMGLTALGYKLADLGVITGKQDKDQDVNALQKATGTGQYKVNLSALGRWARSGFDENEAQTREGDDMASYDWAQPVALALSMGANLNSGKDGNAQATAVESLSGGINTVMEQPLIKGMARLFGYNDPLGGLTETAKALPASFSPTLLNQFKQFTDNTSRNTYDPDLIKQSANMVAQRFPGLSKVLPPRVDVFGQNQEAFQDGTNTIFNVLLNPAFVSKIKTTPEAKLVLDIFEEAGLKEQFPRVVDKKYKVSGQDIQLSPQQYEEMQRYVGTKTKEVFSALAENREFASLTPEQKATAMSSLLTDMGKLAKVDVLGDKKINAIRPIYDQVQELARAGREEEAQAIVDSLTDEQYDEYKAIKSADSGVDTIRREIALLHILNQIQNHISAGNEQEAQALVDGLSDEDYEAYKKLKNKLNLSND